MKQYDVIVVGIGAMGSAAAYSLAKEKLSVLGLEQFALGHDQGSSNGQRRIVRRAYFEKNDYIPLLNAAYPLWDELGKRADRPFFHRVGLVVFGEKGNSRLGERIRQAGRAYQIPLEIISSGEAKERYPFSIPDNFEGVLEPEAGYADVEASLEALRSFAGQEGAELRGEEALVSWESTGKEVTVVTTKGEYRARSLVLTTGGWSGEWLKLTSPRLRPRRAPQMWFKSPATYDSIPCFAFDLAKDFYYGFPPQAGWGTKLAAYTPIDDIADPSHVSPDIPEAAKAEMAGIIQRFLPGVDAHHQREKMCFYTLTPDEDFLLDRHPEFPNVVVATGGSGHAFKFTPVIGEIVTELVTKGKSRLPIGFLGFRRFAH